MCNNYYYITYEPMHFYLVNWDYTKTASVSFEAMDLADRTTLDPITNRTLQPKSFNGSNHMIIILS